MSEKTGLAVVKPEGSAIGLSGSVRIESMGDVFQLASRLAKARGFVPDAYVDKPEALAAVILTGVELGLGPMQAMREVYVVKGKPSLSATLMLALAQRAGVRVRWVKTDATIATIAVTVPGETEQQMSFSKDDAVAAGLWGQGTWKAYPANMLRARCTSAALRAFCPYVFGGGSVYESTSGEITGGVPTENVIEAQVVAETPKLEAPKRAGVKDTKAPDELRAWCAENAKVVADSGAKGLAKVVAHGATLGVGELVVRQWLGLPIETAGPPRELDDGSLDQDPPKAA